MFFARVFFSHVFGHLAEKCIVETDLEVRMGKSKEQTLNDKIMGNIGDRFGGGRKETNFM